MRPLQPRLTTAADAEAHTRMGRRMRMGQDRMRPDKCRKALAAAGCKVVFASHGDEHASRTVWAGEDVARADVVSAEAAWTDGARVGRSGAERVSLLG